MSEVDFEFESNATEYSANKSVDKSYSYSMYWIENNGKSLLLAQGIPQTLMNASLEKSKLGYWSNTVDESLYLFF